MTKYFLQYKHNKQNTWKTNYVIFRNIKDVRKLLKSVKQNSQWLDLRILKQVTTVKTSIVK